MIVFQSCLLHIILLGKLRRRLSGECLLGICRHSELLDLGGSFYSEVDHPLGHQRWALLVFLLLLQLGVALLDLLLDRLLKLLVLLRLTLALIVTAGRHITASTPPELVVVLEVPQSGAECGTGLLEVNKLASRGVFGL